MTAQPPPGNYPPPGGYPPPPGNFPPQGPQGSPPDNNLVWAILCTVLCCLPLGIVAIVKSTQVSGLYAQGRYAEAQKSADDAKKFAMWGAIAGVALGIVWGIIAVAGGMAGMSSGY
ncbi:CD225/dispanin family protein [Mycolicibacterium brisbanense]|uniref:Interferon-induced transmembrane protein n=1 Tax=Mycolicibacterium brisbanense TaxID=146020 RepID=A0A100W108_9MYCO|nr:CD225/dispanin family protein [Mycolicibacterium brisbanense]MCV7156809.1 CD225/dispanin family protein [Mycolicibacterium brisbanense]GAS89526.1 interferon-induced transmembrane protein [Mycolicibacterium brisbanense]